MGLGECELTDSSPEVEAMFANSRCSNVHPLSAFEAKQRKLDEMLDKKLNICRC
jgi:hypothetical protein